MANPFDEFDAPAANPFDEFDAPRGESAAPDLKDVPRLAASNLGSSARRQVEGVVHAITNPSELIDGAWGLTKGLASKLVHGTGAADFLAGLGQKPEEAALNRDLEKQKASFREKTADEVGAALKDRYGGWDNIKRTVAEDPVGAGLDIATVLSGGNATAARLGLKGATTTARAADALVVRPSTELLSGISTEAQRLASQAGEVGGARGRAFRENMAQPDYAGMQDTLQQGVRGAADERAAQYRADMANLPQNALPYRPILQALQDARDLYTGPGGQFVKDMAARDALMETAQTVQRYLRTPSEVGDALSMDALKQAVGDIRQRQPQGSRARTVVDHVYRAIGDNIRATAPEYANAMDRYARGTENLKNVVKTLSAGENATRFTTAGKLLSALRSDASVARGARADALADVSRHVPELPFQVAGATMNPILPRGIVARGHALMHPGTAGVGALGALVNPAFLTALVAASPRAVGNLRYAAGSTLRGARRAGVTQKNFGLYGEWGRVRDELDGGE